MFRLTSRKLAAAIAGLMSLVGIGGLTACAGLPEFAVAALVPAISTIALVSLIGQAYLDAKSNGVLEEFLIPYDLESEKDEEDEEDEEEWGRDSFERDLRP